MEMDSLYWNMMDKNKTTFKLKGIGPIYYLNLDGQPERREYMENQFKYWEVDNYERISAYDGRDDDERRAVRFCLIASFDLVDRGLWHRLPGLSLIHI